MKTRSQISTTISPELKARFDDEIWRRRAEVRSVLEGLIQGWIDQVSPNTGRSLEIPEGLTETDITLLRAAVLDIALANDRAEAEKRAAIERLKTETDKARESRRKG